MAASSDSTTTSVAGLGCNTMAEYQLFHLAPSYLQSMANFSA